MVQRLAAWMADRLVALIVKRLVAWMVETRDDGCLDGREVG